MLRHKKLRLHSLHQEMCMADTKSEFYTSTMLGLDIERVENIVIKGESAVLIFTKQTKICT